MKRWRWRVGLAVAAGMAVGLWASTAAALELPFRSPPKADIPFMPQRQLVRLGFDQVWYRQLPLLAEERVAHAVLKEGTLYCGTTRGRLIALKAATGQLLWDNATGTDGRFWFAPTIHDDSLYMIHGNVLMQIHRATGAIVWKLPLPFVASSGPVVAPKARHIYIGGEDGRLRALRGDEEEKYMGWEYQTEGEIRSRPVEMLDYVAFASTDGKLYASSGEERNVTYSFATDGPITGDLATVGKFVLVPSHDYRLYCIDISSGRKLWEFETGSPIVEAPVVICTDVYVRSLGNGLYRLDAQTGKRLWWRKDIDRLLACSVERVYLLDLDHRLVVADLATGNTLAVQDFSRRFDLLLTNQETDDLYLMTRAGFVLVVRDLQSVIPVAWPASDPKKSLGEQSLKVVSAELKRKAETAQEARARAEAAARAAAELKKAVVEEAAFEEEQEEEEEPDAPLAKPTAEPPAAKPAAKARKEAAEEEEEEEKAPAKKESPAAEKKEEKKEPAKEEAEEE